MDTYTELSRTFRSNITPYAETKWESSVKRTYTNKFDSSCQRDLTHVRKSDWLLRWNDKDVYRWQVLKTVDERKKKEQTDKLLNRKKKPIQTKDTKLTKKGSKKKRTKTNQPVKEVPKEKTVNENEITKIYDSADADKKQLENDEVDTKEDNGNGTIIEGGSENSTSDDKNFESYENVNVSEQEEKTIQETKIDEKKPTVESNIDTPVKGIIGLKEDHTDAGHSKIVHIVDQDEVQNEKGVNDTEKKTTESIEDIKADTITSSDADKKQLENDKVDSKQDNGNGTIAEGSPENSTSNDKDFEKYKSVNISGQEEINIEETKIEDEKAEETKIMDESNIDESIKENNDNAIKEDNIDEGNSKIDDVLDIDDIVEQHEDQNEREENDTERKTTESIDDIKDDTGTSDMNKTHNEKENNDETIEKKSK